MPQRGRSKRAAARQTQLGQRKKRQARGPVAVTQTARAPDAAVVTDAEVALAPEQQPEPRHPEATPVAVAAAPSRPAHSRPSEPRPAIYGYVKSEVQRIGILATGALAVLIALTFVLR